MNEEQGNRPLSSDILEEAAEKFAHLYDNGTCDGIAQDCFIAGAKWQMEQMMDEWLQDRNECFWHGVNEGKKVMEKQMMKDAVECIVTTNLANRPVIYLDQLKGFQYGDKVRIIIVKEDER